jgi:hypothetical protein
MKIMDWTTFISENEVLNPDNPDSFLSFLHTTGVGSFYQMSLFDPSNISVHIHFHVLEHKNIDPYKFLLQCQTVLAPFGYKCKNCDEAEDDSDVEEVEDFKFKAKNPLRFIHLLFKRDNNRKLSEIQKLDILQCMINPVTDMRNPDYVCTDAAKHAVQGKIFDASIDFSNMVMDWDDWISLMNQVITIENNSDFKFSDQVTEFWKIILLQCLPVDDCIKYIIKWNTMVKTSRTQTSVPMFLLTVKTPNDAPRTSDVLIVMLPKDQRHIWNIHWHKLTYNQKLSAIPLLHDIGDTFSDQTPVKLLTAESKFEAVFLPGQIPNTCLDIINNEMEQDLNEFVKEDKEDNIVFLFPLKNEEKMAAACYHKSYLSQSKIFYVCSKEDSMNPKKSVILAISIFQVQVREFPIYIDQENMSALLESDAQFFIVNETPHKADFTVSKDVQDGRANMVSADHCQAGSDKTVSRILPISADSLEDAVSNIQGK